MNRGSDNLMRLRMCYTRGDGKEFVD
ncbi:Protein of unknown function [Pyronema omphalodes CBS 100304]|uniref:Uncharacterized protein n=1 Tax=Pyronema omphalodes (strain CBS 100304) TaxID=1076935 RepID=U4L1U0_PYROM|nr:Protein of unknown function [Pyronema omphalodes CBS 100304]